MAKRLNPENINDVKFYDNFFSRQPWRDDPVRFDFMMRPIKDGSSVVELGCGISILLQKIASIYPNSDVHGLDFSPVAIEKMQQLCPSIEFTLGDFFKTSWADDTFDFVISGDTIEHLEKPRDLIKEMHRICKPGGTLILSTPYKETETRGAFTPEHIWEYDVADIKELMAGFGKVTIQTIKANWEFLIIYCQVKK